MNHDDTTPYTPDASPEFIDITLYHAVTAVRAWRHVHDLGDEFVPMVVLVWDDASFTPCLGSEKMTTDEVAALYATITETGLPLGDVDVLRTRTLMGSIMIGEQTLVANDGLYDALVTVGVESGRTVESAVCCGVKLPIPADPAEVEVIPAEVEPTGYEFMVVGLEAGNRAFGEWQASL